MHSATGRDIMKFHLRKNEQFDEMIRKNSKQVSLECNEKKYVLGRYSCTKNVVFLLYYHDLQHGMLNYSFLEANTHRVSIS